MENGHEMGLAEASEGQNDVATQEFKVETVELAQRIAKSTDALHSSAIVLRDRALKELNHLEIDPGAVTEAGWRPDNWEQMHPLNKDQFLQAQSELGESQLYEDLAAIHENGMAFQAHSLERAKTYGEDTKYWEQSLLVSELEAKVDGALAKLKQGPLAELADKVGLEVAKATKDALQTLRPKVPKINPPGINLNRL